MPFGDNIIIHLTGNVSGSPARFDVSFNVCWALHNVGASFEPGHASTIAVFGSTFAVALDTGLVQHDGINLANFSYHRADEVAYMITSLTALLLHEFPRREDLLLDASYKILSTQQMNRVQVAAFAAQMLERANTDEWADAWRKRVNEYAKKRGWEALDLPKGRPKKKTQ